MHQFWTASSPWMCLLCLCIPTTKQQSKQWMKKGTPGPVKGKVHDTRTKTMVLTFFNSKGMVYNNYVPKDQTVNKDYVLKTLQKFLRKLSFSVPLSHVICGLVIEK